MVVLVIGLALWLAGVLLLANVGGSADFLIRRVTSRSLGSLAPGYAASRRGMASYSLLIMDIGIVCTGIGISGGRWAAAGVLLVLLGVFLFLFGSVVVIAGEVRTYRALKR